MIQCLKKKKCWTYAWRFPLNISSSSADLSLLGLNATIDWPGGCICFTVWKKDPKERNKDSVHLDEKGSVNKDEG